MDTAELKSRAKEQLRGKWAIAVGTVLVANIILEVDVGYKVASKLGIEGLSYSLDLIALLLGGVISVGLCRFLLDMATKRREPRFDTLFVQQPCHLSHKHDKHLYFHLQLIF